MAKQRSRVKRRTKFTVFACLNLTWYCVAVLVLSYLDKTVSDTLTVAWFSAWTVELGLLAGIKIKGKDEQP